MESDRTRVGSSNKKPLRLFLNGYGKMNKEVAKLAEKQGHNIIGFTTKKDPIECKNLKNVDVCIDFSHSSSLLSLVDVCIKENVSLIVGTTDIEKLLPFVQKKLENARIGFLHGPNFSIGVSLYLTLLKEAAHLFNAFSEYDVSGHETHHRKKQDFPSGTAKKMIQILLEKFTRKKECLFSPPIGDSIDEEDLLFSSSRFGYVPGTHSVFFDSEDDTITLTHQAKSRLGFAKGALLSAKWILEKKGFYTFEDFIKDNQNDSMERFDHSPYYALS